MNKEITLKLDYVLRDMIISALRYAIGRKTYIVEETIDFIKSYPNLIDERTKKIMLEDLKSTIDYYETKDIEFASFMKFADWLRGDSDE